jgi:hypothetical protein
LSARGIQVPTNGRGGWLSMRFPVKHSCTLLPRLPRARIRIKLSFIAALSLPFFNGARQPQTGIQSQLKLLLLALWSVPAWKPPPLSPGRSPFKRVDTVRRRYCRLEIRHLGTGHRAHCTLHTTHYFGLTRFEFPSTPPPVSPQGRAAGQRRNSWSKPRRASFNTSFCPRKPPSLQSPQNRGKHEISCQEQS